MSEAKADETRAIVREHYGSLARTTAAGCAPGCCSPGCAGAWPAAARSAP